MIRQLPKLLCLAAATAALASSTACITARAQGPMRVPLVWKPTDDVRLPHAALEGLRGHKIDVGTFLDGRGDDHALIGKNIETRVGGATKGEWGVSTGDDVPAFLAERFRAILSDNGLQLGTTDATRVITAEVRRYFVIEGDSYKAEAVLQFTLQTADGRTLWKGLAEGTSNRWGKSYSAENYYEALGNAYVEAVKNLLKNPEFVRAFGS